METGSKCSVLYINEDKNSKIEVEDCNFSGDLSPGSNHIQVYYNENLLYNWSVRFEQSSSYWDWWWNWNLL